MYLVMKGMKLKVQLINQFKLIGISDNFGEIVIKTRKTHSKKDFYKISVEKIGNLVLKAAPLAETAEISVIIYDKEKNIIAEKTGSFGKEIRASRYITKPGDYFIEFKGVSQEIIPYEFEVLSKEGGAEVEKKSFFETLNLKFIFGTIFLILILFVAGKIIYSVWKK